MTTIVYTISLFFLIVTIMITRKRDLYNLLIYYYNIIGKLLLLSRFFTSEILTACSLLMGHLSLFTPSPLSLFLLTEPLGRVHVCIQGDSDNFIEFAGSCRTS